MCTSLSARADSYTWPQALELARKLNPSLLGAKYALESAKASLRIVESEYAPQVAGVADISRVGGEETSATQSSYGLTAELSIFSGFSTRSAQLSRRKIVEQREAELQTAETRVRSDLRIAFANLLFDQSGLVLDQAIAERLDRNARFVKLRYEGGIEARWAFLKAEADAADARWQISQSEKDLGASKVRLAEVLGEGDGKDLVAVGELVAFAPTQNLSDLEKSIPQTHPDARSLQASSEAFFEDIRGARSGHWPTLTGNADYNRVGIDEWPASDFWSVGAFLRFPLYSGGETVARTELASASYQQSLATLQSRRLQLKTDLIAAHANFSSAVDRIPVSDATLKAAEERAKTIYAQYSAGLKGYLDWEQSQTLLTEAQRTDLQTKFQSLTTLAAWELALGRDLSSP